MVPIQFPGANVIGLAPGTQTFILVPLSGGILRLADLSVNNLLGAGAGGRFSIVLTDGVGNLLLRTGIGWQAAQFIPYLNLFNLVDMHIVYQNGLIAKATLLPGSTAPTSGEIVVNLYRS
jgi:hypothetical protein